MNFQYMDTPIGTLRLVSNSEQLIRIEFENQYGDALEIDGPGTEVSDSVLSACAEQLGEYFAARRQHFELPLCAQGTPFQHSVWSALTGIPYGEVRSYKQIAHTINNPP